MAHPGHAEMDNPMSGQSGRPVLLLVRLSDLGNTHHWYDSKDL